jgi:hypothetical protein
MSVQVQVAVIPNVPPNLFSPAVLLLFHAKAGPLTKEAAHAVSNEPGAGKQQIGL